MTEETLHASEVPRGCCIGVFMQTKVSPFQLIFMHLHGEVHVLSRRNQFLRQELWVSTYVLQMWELCARWWCCQQSGPAAWQLFSHLLLHLRFAEVIPGVKVNWPFCLESSFSGLRHQSWWTVELHNGVIGVLKATIDLHNIIMTIHLLPQVPVHSQVTKHFIKSAVDFSLGCLERVTSFSNSASAI